jgi:hypothetical protein
MCDIIITETRTKGEAQKQEVNTMTKYYRSVNGKPVEITEQEAKEQEKKNQKLFDSGDFSKMMEIEIILKIEK